LKLLSSLFQKANWPKIFNFFCDPLLTDLSLFLIVICTLLFLSFKSFPILPFVLKFLIFVLVLIQFLKHNSIFSIKTSFLVIILYFFFTSMLVYIDFFKFTGMYTYDFMFYFLNYFNIPITWVFHTTSLYFLTIILLSFIYSVVQTIF